MAQPGDDLRPLLFAIAYRMTGSVGDAEDIVQEAYLGLAKAGRDGTEVISMKSYLTTAVTRQAINYLRSARVRRETYVGTWLPEPVVEEPGPAEHAELADSLSMAFMVLLESLAPAERAVFLLREVFRYGYDEIGHAVGKSEAACRQIFSRARRRIRAGDAPALMPLARGKELARRFVAVADGGDMAGLLELLSPDVVFYGDGGGKAQAVRKPVRGPEQVARLLAGVFRRRHTEGVSLRHAVVNGQPGLVAYDVKDQVISVFALDMADGMITAVRSVINPDKLQHLGPVSGLGRLA